MEERKLRAHLIRIYVVTIAIILAGILVAILMLSVRDLEQKSEYSFSTLMTAMGDELQTDNVVRHSELRRLEQENRLLIRVGDNGKTLLYNSMDSSEKGGLLEKAENVAKEAGYDTQSLPLTNARRTSPIFNIADNGMRYLCAVCVIPLDKGYRTLTVVQQQETTLSGSILLYSVLFIGGVLLFGGVGVLLIDRALLPALESRKRQKQFIAAASHELRSPLAVISANAETLSPDTREAEVAVGIITAECARMSRLIGDLLLLASADAESWAVAAEPLELDTLLMNVYESYAPLYQKNGCSLALLLPEEKLPQIRGDGGRIQQVLGILLENALSYGMTRENRSVTLSVVPLRQRVCISVADHGAGLTAEQKAHVFDRFYRADTARKEKQHFGLGLSIARELVSLHKGTLDIQDTPGGGCTFRVLLG